METTPRSVSEQYRRRMMRTVWLALAPKPAAAPPRCLSAVLSLVPASAITASTAVASVALSRLSSTAKSGTLQAEHHT